MSKSKDTAKKDVDERDEDSDELLLETHRHLIPVGTQSCWSGQSDDEDEEQERSEECERNCFFLKDLKMGRTPEAIHLLSTVRRLLSEKLAPINARDEDQYTPLHRAAYSGHLDMARELVAQGADVHAQTVDGWTPLHSACKWNNTKVASFLLQQGADINAQTNGLLTPLHIAAGNKNSRETLELLLMNRYVKADLKNNLDETALDIARRTDVYHYLFEIVEDCINAVTP
uniref:Ankyrin repeat domain 49 n=1 Tax=Anas platyrhynchos TaxID=8839 RepID=A0A8B9SHT2_ANAPL